MMNELPTPLSLPDGRMVQLRHATVEDAADLREIERQIIEEARSIVTDEATPIDAWRRDLARDKGGDLWLVAAAGTHAVGLLKLQRPAPRYLHHQRFLSVELHRDYRGVGLGSAMMDAAVRWSRDKGVTLITLCVLDSNARAKRLYERLGFVTCGYIPTFVRLPDGRYVGNSEMMRQLDA